MLESHLGALPTADDVNLDQLAAALAGRPLSDVAFVVREGARIAARARLHALNQTSLIQALASTPSRAGDARPRIGFL
jgi:hypothetical protein